MAPPNTELRAARLAAGLTQRALAERLGVLPPTVSRWEAGGVDPVVRMAVRIAREVGATVEALWPTDNGGGH